MTDSLFNILQKKDFDEPPEMVAIKKFVQDNYQTSVEVLVRERDIIIAAPSAALASTLRLRVTELRDAAKTKKRLVFRIR